MVRCSSRLQETAVTLHLRHYTRIIPYDTITAVSQNRLFLIIHTTHGRYFIERSIQRSPYLVAELKRRAPALRQAAVQYITNPLPRHLAGKSSMFLMGFGLFLVFKIVAVGITTVNDNQDQMQQSLLEFLPVLEHHYQIKPVHHREQTLAPFHRFGNGSHNDFRWYFERESQLKPATVEETCRWLKQCRYVSDEEQFNTRDHWLHPVEFEASRQGDCEDHALWAWRKLVELGIPAEFVVGQAKWADDHPTEAHAWVTFTQNGRAYLLEATAKTEMVCPLETTASLYHPWYSIDQDFQTYQHNRYVKANLP
ncbi:MAG: hypothetical protein BroJett015_05640 [Chloroflexota bacterium]|nr:transglutaminase domain-containing protein [Ardenticatenaceae bacterium]GIK54901.1 MAG: hypothetical protein BroJett015_05640 [Chloroflexota bacterium]